MFAKRLIQILFLFVTMVFAQGAESVIPVAEPAPAPVPVAQPAIATPEPAPAPAPVAQPAIATLAPSDTNKSTISVFVKSPEELRQLKEELKNLQTMAGDSNPEIAALLERANRVAAMNDRCSSISINDLLDTTCARFYEVELPAFENEYMEVTGEVRLGSMQMATTLEERIRQLSSCSEALTSIVVSREQLLRIRGNVYLEPINYEGDFDAEYNFALSYDPARLAQQMRLANLWIEKCGSIVLRQSGSEFAPMFVATLKVKNDSLKKTGSNVKIMMNKKTLSLRVDMRRPVSGAYYLNGIRLFEKTLEADKKQSHLIFDIKNKKAVPADGTQEGVIQQFQGKRVFNKIRKTEMVGRWIWDSEQLPDEVAHAGSQDESEVMTAEDSLAYKQGLEDLERVMAEEHNAAEARRAEQAAEAAKSASDKNKSEPGIRWVPFAVSITALVGGSIMAFMYDRKARDERDAYQSELATGNDTNFEQHDKAVGDYQRNRAIGLGLAALGTVGIVLSFVF